MKTRDAVFVLAAILIAVAGAFTVNFQGTPAMAQGKADAGGMIAFPFSHTTGQQAICLIDTRNGVICVYEVGVRRKYNIELKAARDYTYDVQVKELSTKPRPKDVKKEVDKLLKMKNGK